MSSTDALKELEQALLATVYELEDQRNASRELVTTEMLLAVAGRSAAAAYEEQLAAIHEATEAHRQAAEAVKAQKDAAKSNADKVKIAGEVAATAFAKAREFADKLKGMAAEANPDAWSTMSDSFKLVTMQLGQYFLPAIIVVSYKAQELAQWLGNLSPETKHTVGMFATVAAGLYGVSKAAGALNGVLLGIPGKLAGKLGEAAGGSIINSLTGISPAAKGAAAGLAIAGVGAALLYAKAQQLAASWDDMEKKLKDVEAGKGITREDVEAGSSYKAAKEQVGKGSTGQLKMADIFADEEARLDRQQRRIVGELKEKTDGLGGRVKHWWNEDKVKELQEEAVQTERKQKINRLAKQELLYGHKYVPTHAEDLTPKAAKQAGALQGLLMHAPKEMQPHFSAVEEARKQFQMGALKDPLEQELMRLNREAAQKMVEMAPLIIERLRKGESILGLL